MDINEFLPVLNTRLQKTRDTLDGKADEYSRGGDRLSNFKQIAHLLSCTPERALIGLISKHIVALVDFINDLDDGTVQPYERWDEKMGDIVAYMVLLDALIIERSQ